MAPDIIPPRESLDDLARHINEGWTEADERRKEADDRRLTTALRLKEAKDRIEAGEDPEWPDFLDWCAEKLTPHRSEREIDRLLRRRRQLGSVACGPRPGTVEPGGRRHSRDQQQYAHRQPVLMRPRNHHRSSRSPTLFHSAGSYLSLYPSSDSNASRRAPSK